MNDPDCAHHVGRICSGVCAPSCGAVCWGLWDARPASDRQFGRRFSRPRSPVLRTGVADSGAEAGRHGGSHRSRSRRCWRPGEYSNNHRHASSVVTVIDVTSGAARVFGANSAGDLGAELSPSSGTIALC